MKFHHYSPGDYFISRKKHSKFSILAWFSFSRFNRNSKSLTPRSVKCGFYNFMSKPSNTTDTLLTDHMYEITTFFLNTLEIFSFGGVECRKLKNLLERLSRGFQGVYLMKKYPGTLVTTKLDKSSAIFIRYPIINSIASDRLPIFLPINRHSQPKDKPLGLYKVYKRSLLFYIEYYSDS